MPQAMQRDRRSQRPRTEGEPVQSHGPTSGALPIGGERPPGPFWERSPVQPGGDGFRTASDGFVGPGRGRIASTASRSHWSTDRAPIWSQIRSRWPMAREAGTRPGSSCTTTAGPNTVRELPQAGRRDRDSPVARAHRGALGHRRRGSVWPPLKREVAHRYRCPPSGEARRTIFAWINRYTHHRPHSSLGDQLVEWENLYRRPQGHPGPANQVTGERAKPVLLSSPGCEHSSLAGPDASGVIWSKLSSVEVTSSPSSMISAAVTPPTVARRSRSLKPQ